MTCGELQFYGGNNLYKLKLHAQLKIEEAEQETDRNERHKNVQWKRKALLNAMQK